MKQIYDKKISSKKFELKEKDFKENFYPCVSDAILDSIENCEYLERHFELRKYNRNGIYRFNNAYWVLTNWEHYNGYFYNVTLKQLI